MTKFITLFYFSIILVAFSRSTEALAACQRTPYFLTNITCVKSVSEDRVQLKITRSCRGGYAVKFTDLGTIKYSQSGLHVSDSEFYHDVVERRFLLRLELDSIYTDVHVKYTPGKGAILNVADEELYFKKCTRDGIY